MTMGARIFCGFLLFALAGCSGVELNMTLPSIEKLAALTERKPAWRSPLLQQHHLVGRIWRPADGRFVDQETLMEDLVRSAFILLGEKHDNADHHLLQARVIHGLTAKGRRPAIVWEMIPEAKQEILNRAWTGYSHDAAGLGGALGWSASGWPAWDLYQPIAEAAMAARLRMFGAGLSKETVRTLARGKPSFAFAKRRRALGLSKPMPKALRQRSLEQLYQAHCELMPRDALQPLLNVQQFRDAVFAEHLVSSSASDGALLIAGAGHVRHDLGVPRFLARHQPDVKTTTVAFLEVQDGILDPGDYAAGFSAPVLPFDYVWFTPRADDQDHCAKLKKSWPKTGGKKPEMSTDTASEPAETIFETGPVQQPAPPAAAPPQPAADQEPDKTPEQEAQPPAAKEPEKSADGPRSLKP